jgi:ribokinase
MNPLRVDIWSGRYQALIGVGGIGAGSFFALNGNHTLAREESRSGRFLDRRDYCKLHIIAHYVQALLGPRFTTIPIGKVGDDDVGERLRREMEEVGLDMRYVRVVPGSQTLFSFCFIYPDGSGGNLTTDDSACSCVDPAYVASAEPEFAHWAEGGIALAAPEVPLAARRTLLDLGTRHHLLRVASFAAGEVPLATQMGMLEQTDLLALNVSEAAAIANLPPEEQPPEAIAGAAVEKLQRDHPAVRATITAGGRGSWTWDGERLTHRPAIPVAVASTAGAGDAFLAGMLVGLAAGMSMEQAHELAALVAAHSVTSPHTINKTTNRESLYRFSHELGMPPGDAIVRLLEATQTE